MVEGEPDLPLLIRWLTIYKQERSAAEVVQAKIFRRRSNDLDSWSWQAWHTFLDGTHSHTGLEVFSHRSRLA